MEYFIVLSEELNFSYAAERLGISQPTLTQMVQKLEKELGAELFQKAGRSMTLSREGRVFLDACRRIVRIWNDARAEIEDLNSGLSGSIRLGLGPSRAVHLLPTLLDRFSAAYPLVRLDVEERLTAETEEGLLNGELDLGLTAGSAVKQPGLTYLPALEEEILVAAHPRLSERLRALSALGDAAPVRAAPPAAFEGVPFVLLSADQSIARMFTQCMASHGVALNVISRCKTASTGLALADSRVCAALVTSSLRADVSRLFPELKFFSVDAEKLKREVYIAYRSDRTITAPEKRLIEIIKETE